MKKKLCLFILLIGFNSLCAQENFPNTLTYDESIGAPAAKLASIAWIQGYWVGEAFGGITEEVWTPPLGNSMMCTFKLVVAGKVQFYELVTIVEENNTLIMRLKHFDGALKGWETKDETIDFKLVKITDDIVYFDQFTFEKVNEREMNIYVVIENNGKKEEVKFNYNRRELRN